MRRLRNLTAYRDAVRPVLLVENLALLLCGSVVSWAAIMFVPGPVLKLVAITAIFAAGGRLLFDGTFWAAGLGFVFAGLLGAGFQLSNMVSSLSA